MTMKRNTELNTMMFFDGALEDERTQLLTELAAACLIQRKGTLCFGKPYGRW